VSTPRKRPIVSTSRKRPIVPTPHDSVLIFLGNSENLLPDLSSSLPPSHFVIAADSGLHLAQKMGIQVDVVVGDLDSVSADALDLARKSGVRVAQHPRDKEQTDFELALHIAIAHGQKISIIGNTSGRFDHVMGNCLVLAAPAFAEAEIEARLGTSLVWVAGGRKEGPQRTALLKGTPGHYVSLLPLHGPVTGARTHGLRFPLHNETLFPGSSRSLSNEFLTSEARVEVETGTLLIIAPGSGPQDPPL